MTKTEAGLRSGSLTLWVGPVVKGAGRGEAEQPVQIPERTVTPGRGPGSCPFHKERLGLEVCVSRGHSGSLIGLKECSVVWLHSALS